MKNDSVLVTRLACGTADMLALILLPIVSNHDTLASARLVAELAAPTAVPTAPVHLEGTVAQGARLDRISSWRRVADGLKAKSLTGFRVLAGGAEGENGVGVLADEVVGDLTTHCGLGILRES